MVSGVWQICESGLECVDEVRSSELRHPLSEARPELVGVDMSRAGVEPPARPARRTCCRDTWSNPVVNWGFLDVVFTFDVVRRVAGRVAVKAEPFEYA